MTPLNTNRSLKNLQIVGYASIFLMVGSFGAWSALTQINGAVIAQATVIAESSTKRIQAKDGGIIKEILIKDGDEVAAGQDLIVIDDTETRAELGIVDSLLVEQLARRARLEAQRDGLTSVMFPPELRERASEPEVAAIMQGQIRLFNSQNEGIQAKKDQLEQQVAQLSEQIQGMDAQTNSHQEQIDLIAKELKGLLELQKQGLVAISRVLAMQREKARLEGEVGQLTGEKAATNQRISEIKLQMLQLDGDARTATLTELREAESRIAEFQERKLGAAARLSRTVIKSPIAGDVYQLMVHTIGGVVQPAETLMLIAPREDQLVLQAQISPQNIEQVSVGQKARLRFPAFESRFTPEIYGEVSQVAADITRIDANTPPFYAVRLTIDSKELDRLEGKKLKAGMPAEAFIQTSERSPLSYLVKPMMDQMAHTFRER